MDHEEPGEERADERDPASKDDRRPASSGPYESSLAGERLPFRAVPSPFDHVEPTVQLVPPDPEQAPTPPKTVGRLIAETAILADDAIRETDGADDSATDDQPESPSAVIQPFPAQGEPAPVIPISDSVRDMRRPRRRWFGFRRQD